MSQSDPFRELTRMFDRMSRQFSEASSQWEGQWGLPSGSSPDVDLIDRPEEYVLHVDLPGFTESDVTVTLSDRTLRIEAEREEETETEGEEYLRRERRHASLSRRVQLPEPVEGDDVSAELDAGVLTVRVPKAAVDEGRRIEVT
ncbi:MAG: Hsp20/alpha crystallin family protein [Haloarculaceae archaeon]